MFPSLTDFLLFAEGAAEGAPVEDAPKVDPTMGFLVSMLPWVGIAFLFYFLMIRPQKQERNRHNDMLDALKKNDRVVTIGGIIGTVADVTEKTVTLKVDDNTRIKMQRRAVQGRLGDEEDSK